MTEQISHFIDGGASPGNRAAMPTSSIRAPEVQATVPLAGKAEVDAAVAAAVEAQRGWAAWNPQRRARVLMRFIELVNQHTDELAELLSLRTRQNRRRLAR